MRLALIISLALLATITNAQNINQWRGTDRTGIYKETDLLEEWPEEGPELLWYFDKLGKGFSSAIVNDDKVYTTGMEDSLGYVYCINTKGELLWKTNYGIEWHANFPGARTTPTFDNGRLYLLCSPFNAMCLDAKDGSTIWQNKLNEMYGAQQLRFGNTESPLVVDDKVIYTPGGTEGTMVAFNKNTGEQVWVNKIDNQTSTYSSPLLINHNGRKIIVTALQKSIVGVQPTDGKVLWQYPQINRRDNNPNTPTYDGENIYSFTGYGKGGMMLKLSEDGSSVSLGWENEFLDNQMGGYIVIDGRAYGSGHTKTAWHCLDAYTGDSLYTSKELMNGTVIYNDGLLYCYSQKSGMLSLLKPTENKFIIKGSVKVEHGSDQHWAHPVICNGVLYIRHGNSLLAYNIKE